MDKIPSFLYNGFNEENPMITFTNITKEYHVEEHTIKALQQVTFSLGETGFVSILGPSGCGKTTLLNLMGGLDHPTSGSMTIHGIATENFDEHAWNNYRNRDVGFVFQSFFLIPHLTILENVMLPLKLAGLSPDEQKNRSLEVLKSVGLEHHIHHRPNQLSGGQQQRSAIARALVTEPKMILADEPTGSLDHQASIEIMEILKEISSSRLVVMVSHNQKLSSIYSDRILTMEDGKIVSDEYIHPLNEKKSNSNELSITHAKMSFVTAFKLSISNLRKRFYRTLLMVLAASIGVLGMTLVLAVSSGFDRFLELRKTETLNAFPIRVERVSAVVPFFDDKYKPNLPLFSDEQILYPSNIQYEFTTINTLTPEYYTYVKNMDPSIYRHIHYNFGTTQSFLAIHQDSYYLTSDTFDELTVDSSYLNNHFDLLAGKLPDDQKNEAVIVVDRYNRLSKELVQNLGFSGQDEIAFDTLLSLDIKWIPNNFLYQFDGAYYLKKNTFQDDLINLVDVDIVGVIRIQDKYNLDLLHSGIYYTEHLGNLIRENAKDSDVVQAQMSSSTSVLNGSSLTAQTKETLLRSLGYGTYPVSYAIYSNTFDHKDDIIHYLRAYNDTVSNLYQIEPLDIAGIGLSTMRIAIDSMTIILIVFSGISLLISNLMIGIMTYTSVIERTKEIGVLRAIGARKKDVGRIFYAETLVVGFFSGLLGVILTYALLPLFNLFLEDLTTIKQIGYLPIYFAFGLVVINTLITSLSGIVPAQIASNKDPISCLRNE